MMEECGRAKSGCARSKLTHLGIPVSRPSPLRDQRYDPCDSCRLAGIPSRSRAICLPITRVYAGANPPAARFIARGRSIGSGQISQPAVVFPFGLVALNAVPRLDPPAVLGAFALVQIEHIVGEVHPLRTTF